MKHKKTTEPQGDRKLDRTSSLNKYFLCDCGRKFFRKLALHNHVMKCVGMFKPVVCHWCKLEFTNMGNLATHAFYMHGDKSYKSTKSAEIKCEACDATFKERRSLKYHIRKQHFNLWAKIPNYEAKEINQTWYEKVSNSNLILEMKKTSPNTILMKPRPPSAMIQITDAKKRIDLRNLYPTARDREDEICKICKKVYRKNDMKKHMDEKHTNNIKTKCNNCNRSFKRMYIYLNHVCNKANLRNKRKVNGVKQYGSIRITGVESLKAVEVD